MPGGGYRYWRHPELGPEYERAMDSLFDTYARSLPAVEAWAADRFPRGDAEPESAYRRSIKAKALDLLRGVLPAASLSHMGIFASGQAYEQLVLHLMASPLPEARDYGSMILSELNKVIPSFLARVERPSAAASGSSTCASAAQAAERWAARFGLDRGRARASSAPRCGCSRSRGSEDDLLAALLFEATSASEEEIRATIRVLPPDEREQLLAELVGERANRRHRPGRGFEAVSYRFEVVSDYGAFRDLQRHRMLTVQWQPLTPHLGAGLPEELVDAGVADDYRAALDRSQAEYERLVKAGHGELAPYALCLGYRIRYILDMNAREAMQLIELRSGREGHPAYRAVAHELHAQIAAVHPRIAAAMKHVDRETEPRLERILSEIRTQAKRAAAV